MSDFELFKSKKKKEKADADIDKNSDLLSDLDVDLDSDHPVHEEFVSDKNLREIRKKNIRKI